MSRIEIHTAVRVPALVPILGRGAHPDPATGACLMEYASVLAGEPFSDHPQCVHPVLAALARAVNDLISDAGRQRLLHLLPEIIGTQSPSPAVTAGLMQTCARAGLRYRPGDGELIFVDRQATRRLRRAQRNSRLGSTLLTLSEWDVRRLAVSAARRAARLAAETGDEALYELLAAATAACRPAVRRVPGPEVALVG